MNACGNRKVRVWWGDDAFHDGPREIYHILGSWLVGRRWGGVGVAV